MKRALWMAASPLVKVTTYVVLILATIWVLIPFVWSVQNSIKTMADIFNPLAIIPFIIIARPWIPGSRFWDRGR